jgi:hypothetical protein
VSVRADVGGGTCPCIAIPVAGVYSWDMNGSAVLLNVVVRWEKDGENGEEEKGMYI